MSPWIQAGPPERQRAGLVGIGLGAVVFVGLSLWWYMAHHPLPFAWVVLGSVALLAAGWSVVALILKPTWLTIGAMVGLSIVTPIAVFAVSRA
jgi:hypothetical protein